MGLTTSSSTSTTSTTTTATTVKALRAAKLSVTEISFEPALEQLLEGHVENAKFERVHHATRSVDLDSLPASTRRSSREAEGLARSADAANAEQLVPMYAAQVASSSYARAPAGRRGPPTTPSGSTSSSRTAASSQVSTAAVKCASQLYYVMTLGDELGVFDAVRYFTHRYLFREGFAIEDRALRRDLENYVFSEQFPGHDEETGEHATMHVTHEAERRSFYRQVFNLGERAGARRWHPANDGLRPALEDPHAGVGPLPRARTDQPAPGQLRVAAERHAGGRGPPVQPVDELRRAWRRS